MKLSKDRYSYLIHKDMEWLTANTERTIERDHIMAVLEDSISLQYPNENMEEKEEKTSRRFNVGDNVRRKSTCSAGVVTELFNEDMYGVLFNGRVLDAASGDDLEVCTAEEVAAASNVTRLLEGAEFGDKYNMANDGLLIYLDSWMMSDGLRVLVAIKGVAQGYFYGADGKPNVCNMCPIGEDDERRVSMAVTGRYSEEIDKEHVEKLAEMEYPMVNQYYDDFLREKEAFVKGYIKAKEEKR